MESRMASRKERERKSPVEFGRLQKRENAIQMELYKK